MTKKLKTVFFGSGPVAAKSLRLLAQDFDIEAVVTKPKPEHHRGNFPVLDVAEKLNLKVHTVSNKTELSNLIAARPFNSEFGVLIDFGIIVAQDTIDYFVKGIINSHFSLLPEWRGADPITFSILSGQSKTGVSLMLIDAGMDTGKLIAQKSVAIPDDATTPSLTSTLIELSHTLLAEKLPLYSAGTLKPRQQPHPARATYSRKLTKEDGRVDWDKPAVQIEREIRAYLDWPRSFTSLAGKEVIITKAHILETDDIGLKPGAAKIVGSEIGKYLLFVQTRNGTLVIDRLKPAGKTEMSASAFIAGYGTKLNK